MKKQLFWKSLTIMMVAMVYVCFTSCSGDDDDSLPDPKGTVSAVMSAQDGGIDLFNYTVPINVWVSSRNSSDWYFNSGNTLIDIYDCGNVQGLASITSIPNSGWVRITSKPSAIIGHGYIARYTNSNFGIVIYTRIYIVGEANQGLSVKYQTPFDPSTDVVDSGENVSAEVVGTWMVGGVRKRIFTFSNDGTGTFTSSEINKSGVPETGKTGTFTWTMESDSRGSMKMTYSDNRKESLYFEINGNRMTVYDNPEYKSADWYLTKQN